MPVVEQLRLAGNDVLTVLETGKSDQAWPDEAVLDFATQESRILLTLNRRHFIRLHQLKPGHAGIVVCTFNADFASQATQIDEALNTAGDLRGKLLRINRQ